MEIRKPEASLPPPIKWEEPKIPPHLKRHLKQKGMWIKPNESKKDWIKRLREWAKTLGYSSEN